MSRLLSFAVRCGMHGLRCCGSRADELAVVNPWFANSVKQCHSGGFGGGDRRFDGQDGCHRRRLAWLKTGITTHISSAGMAPGSQTDIRPTMGFTAWTPLPHIGGGLQIYPKSDPITGGVATTIAWQLHAGLSSPSAVQHGRGENLQIPRNTSVGRDGGVNKVGPRQRLRVLLCTTDGIYRGLWRSTMPRWCKDHPLAAAWCR